MIEKARYGSKVDFTFQIDAVPGKVSLINLLFRNPFKSSEKFKVQIETESQDQALLEY